MDQNEQFVEQVARVVHEANRAYCVTLGDNSQVPWDEAPQWQRASARDGVVGILSGRIQKPSDSHESWLAQKEADGWKFGPVKDPDKKEHPCMVPYTDLSPDQQVKDHIFFAVVNAMK